MGIKTIISIDPNILGGTPVFTRTRTSVEGLFGHLESGVALGELPDDFPSVSKEQAVALMGAVSKLLTSKNV